MTLLHCSPENHSTYRILRQLDINIIHKDVLFAGSHDLIEKDTFQRCGVNKVICFEANNFVYTDLQERLRDTNWPHFCACLWSEVGTRKEFYFYRQKKDGASGLFLPDKMGEYVDCQPTGEKIVLKTTTIDNYIQNKIIDISNVNLAIFDLQGSELRALIGSKLLLESCQLEWIICEVSNFSCYLGAPQEPEITHFLEKYGFRKIAFQLDWSGKNGEQHGDNIYKKY